MSTLDPAPTEQEQEVIEALRRHDGGPDGDLARCFALWARGEVRVLFDPPDREEIEHAILLANHRRGAGGCGQPIRPLI